MGPIDHLGGGVRVGGAVWAFVVLEGAKRLYILLESCIMCITLQFRNAYLREGYIIMATTRKPRATKTETVNMFHYDIIENGKLLHIEQPVKTFTPDMVSALVTADKDFDDVLIGALFIGKALPIVSGSALVKSINETRAKGTKAITKNDIKAAYDKLQAYARIRELSTEPLQMAWDKFTADKIAEREALKKENAELEAKGEKAKTLPRIAKPSVNGILAMLKPVVDVDHLQAFLKSAKTAYNHLLECKGKKAQQDAEKLAALIVSNGGQV